MLYYPAFPYVGKRERVERWYILSLKKVIKKRKNGSLYVGYVNTEPSLTNQAIAPEVDIHNIIYGRTTNGLPPNQRKPLYGIDLSAVPTLQESLTAIANANSEWEKLPHDIKERFNNNPKQLFKFLNDEKNHDEAVNLGLLKVAEAVEPITVQVVNPLTPDNGVTDGSSATD